MCTKCGLEGLTPHTATLHVEKCKSRNIKAGRISNGVEGKPRAVISYEITTIPPWIVHQVIDTERVETTQSE